jgi:ubiquinone/menaquinone biosynthesis C-methylase UbiE
MQGRNAALVSRYFPSYRSPKDVYQDVLLQEVGTNSVWLDLGCGKRAARDEEANRMLPRRARLAVGCDRDPGLRHSSIENLVRADGAALPFRSATFSLVTAAMVVEHLQEPLAVFREVARVCRPDARFVVFTPNVLNYGMLIARITPHRFHVFIKKMTHYLARREWRDFDRDLFPTWYRANRLGRLRHLLHEAGFVEQRLERLSFAHSFGFLKPFYIGSLLFERSIDRHGLRVLKADLLGVFRRAGGTAST